MMKEKLEHKTLLVDLETAPNLGYCWQKWETDIVSFKEDWYILSFAYKWLGEKETKVVSLPQFKTFKKDKSNDKELCKKLWELFDEAEVIIAHNGNSFDIKKSNSRFIFHDFTPPTPYKTIDTKLEAKRYFRFDSNKLDDLGQYLNLGRKINAGGFDTWLGCMNGDQKSWDKMCEYNKQDVILLEKIYLKLRGWMTSHPNLNLINSETCLCPNCGSKKLYKQGFAITRVSKRQRFQCQDCGCWCQGEIIKQQGIPIR